MILVEIMNGHHLLMHFNGNEKLNNEQIQINSEYSAYDRILAINGSTIVLRTWFS